MERNHHEAPARAQTIGRDLQNRGHFIEFGINDDSDGLKSPSCRIFARCNRARPASNDPGNQGSEFSGATQSVFTRLKTPGHDRSRNGCSRSFFAVQLEGRRNLGLVSRQQPIASRDAPGRVHAHVQGTIVTKTEPATCVVELRTGNSQVDQYAVNGYHPMGLQHVGQFRERRVINRKARVINRPRCSDRFRVTVNRNEPAIGAQSI